MKRVSSLLASVLLCGMLTAHAAEKPDKAAKRAAILMQKMKQDMEAEKSVMQSQFEQEKKGLTEALGQAQTVQRAHSAKLQGQVKRTQQLQAENQKLTEEKAALQTQVQQLQTQLAEQAGRAEAAEQALNTANTALAVNDGQRKKLLGTVSRSQQQLVSCEEKNSRLYSYGHALVNLYADASLYQKVMREEPFFQFKRVELENILQEKQAQLIENKIDTIDP